MNLGNTEIRKLEEDVIAIFNQSYLPIEVKRLIAECVLNIIIKDADRAIIEENSPSNKNIVYGEENGKGEIVLKEESRNAENI